MLQKSKYSYLNRHKFMAIAHRGASQTLVENTMESFLEAYNIGFRNFELDVHSSRDGEVFVCHDDNLFRLTGESILLNSLSGDEVRSIFLNNNTKIPTLIEVLEEFPDVQFNIDAKSWEVVDHLCEVIEKTKCKERICVGGFNDFRTRKIVKRIGPGVCYSPGPLGVICFYLSYFLRIKRVFPSGCLQLPQTFLGFKLVSKASIKFAHECDLMIHVWTVNDEHQMINLINFGVDGIMTDDCRILKKVLKKYDLWLDNKFT